MVSQCADGACMKDGEAMLLLLLVVECCEVVCARVGEPLLANVV